MMFSSNISWWWHSYNFSSRRRLQPWYYFMKNTLGPAATATGLFLLSLIQPNQTKEIKSRTKTNQNISNIKSPSHQGITIGKVIDIKNNKIKIKLTKELNQNDGIKFTEDKGMIANFIYNEKNLLINQGKKDQIIYLDNKIGLAKKTSVQKTTDIKLIKEINNSKNYVISTVILTVMV